jgi:hypothetical protein
MSPELTSHAATRSQQRSLRLNDLDAVLAQGTLLRDGSVFLSEKDVDAAIASRTREIRQLERLKNTRVVLAADRIVTVYKATAKTQRRLVRADR